VSQHTGAHSRASRTGVLLLLIALATGADVRIVRDEYGVPHVYARDLGALFFGFGHAVAQDRLFQLEMTRHSAWGRVSSSGSITCLADRARTGGSFVARRHSGFPAESQVFSDGFEMPAPVSHHRRGHLKSEFV
jgi:hypothetical protein